MHHIQAMAAMMAAAERHHVRVCLTAVWRLGDGCGIPATVAGATGPDPPLKRIARIQIHAMRFSSLFLCMSLSRNRCTLSGDMH
jgi:hypothetical protein